MSSISANGETDIVYIQYESGIVYAKINDGEWSEKTGPITVFNSNPTPGVHVLQLLFTTNMTITQTTMYFQCTSDGIQFGSKTLGTNGSRPIITISIANYEGFIQNGTDSTPGYNNIYVYNLVVDGTGYTTQIGGGWIGAKYFGYEATNNYIINCSSSGTIGDQAGGILGQYSGSGSGATLYVRGCSSSGSITQLGGGILGSYAGSSGGSAVCEQCFATGIIQGFAGGIFGDYAGDGGYAEANKCYTTGLLGNSTGGIYGRFAGNFGQAYASKCYSKGIIDTDAGGIYGIGAGSDGGITQANNCYSGGLITTTNTGIYGTGKANGTELNCYAADDSWSTADANISLQGFPISPNTVGTVWVSRGLNEPYELNAIGYTPYTLTNIDSSSDLLQTFSQSIEPGQTTGTAAIIASDPSGNDFTILQASGGEGESYATITMNSQTAAISTTASTKPGTYTIYVRSLGSYNITTYVLLVTAGQEAEVSVSCCERTMDLKGIDYTTRAMIIAGNTLIGNTTKYKNTLSYADLIHMKMAYASKR
jgi:hypothetical protein